ncbi:heme exporter protein CcmD [Methyloceanibacter superfactus]|jgi:heme exporter protein D|uniref:heme exporter protein CcmD n=1 Tax=Methyloceanibacter superfactus TaxID=1774969 RepID=UPI00084989CE|nr:heme exporter protein CcmD [Methyloceanibacter superfactus]
MLDLGPHASFILAAYGVTAIAVAVLVVTTLADDRTQRRKLADLERRGIRRRSATPPKAAKTVTPKTTPSMTAPPGGETIETDPAEATAKKPASKRKPAAKTATKTAAKRKTAAKAKAPRTRKPRS